MELSTIRVKTKNKKPKRLGRGTGSTTGKTAGRGHKGAGQRKGKRLPYAGFTNARLTTELLPPLVGLDPLERGAAYRAVRWC